MSGKQNDLTDKEIEDLQNITTNTLASICTMADKHNIDRNSMLKYFADMLAAFAEVASIQDYETSHTNSGRIRNMSDEELAEFLAYNAYCEECYVEKDDSCCYPDGTCKKKHLDWLQSEAE